MISLYSAYRENREEISLSILHIERIERRFLSILHLENREKISLSSSYRENKEEIHHIERICQKPHRPPTNLLPSSSSSSSSSGSSSKQKPPRMTHLPNLAATSATPMKSYATTRQHGKVTGSRMMQPFARKPSGSSAITYC